MSLNTQDEAVATVLDPGHFRSHMGQISRHSAVFFAGTVFTAAAGYLFKVYLARVLGAEALGVYTLGMTIIGFAGIFGGLGLPQAAVRFVASYAATGKAQELRGFVLRSLGLLLAANVVLSFVVILGGPWIAEHFYHTPALERYLWLFALIMVFGALTAFFGQVLQGYKDVSRRTVITNFIGTPLMMLLTVALVAFGHGLGGYIFAQVLSAAVVLVVLVIAAWKLSPAAARHWAGPLPPLARDVLSFSVAVFGIVMLEFLLAQVDKILIGVYINAREVGIYAVAMAIVAFVPIALQSVNQIFTPTIADLHSRGERELLGRLFQTLTKWVFAFTLPLATVVIAFAKPLMGIFGPDFLEGWPVLVVGVLGQLINCGTGPVGYLLLMSGNQRRLIKVQTTMTAVMILLDVALIPRWGIMGAALASATTMVLSNTWYLGEVRAALGLIPFNRSYFKLVVPFVAMTAATILLRSWWTHSRLDLLFIGGSIILGYVIFFGGALSFGLNADDRIVGDAVWSKLRVGFRRGQVSL